jgi:hypothetical protein
VSVLWPQRVEEGGDGSVGFQASPLAAAAEGSALVDGDVADLARAAEGAADQGAVHEQPAPDAVVELERHAVVAAAARPPDVLAERRQVGVVVDAHRDVERSGDIVPGHAAPAGEYRGRLDGIGVPADRAGQ